MRQSGDTADLSAVPGVKVDKHSSGGVGDKTTLVTAPLAAACGVPVAKMSGRGLGFTGGTVDKMESVPGLRTNLETDAFIRQVNRIGIALIGQTGRIAPADKKLYALRDVTATVDAPGLIASSIMSKKLASGSDAFVLDVKYGDGAFMATVEAAEALGALMAEIGAAAGKKTVAVISSMEQPLGNAVGNSLEVIEAIETLKGGGPEDVRALSLQLAACMVCAGGLAASPQDGLAAVRRALESGAALEKLQDCIAAQGGDPAVTETYSLFPAAGLTCGIDAARSGYVTGISARDIGLASQRAGAGRETKDAAVDPAAGVYLRKKVGDPVAAGERLAEVYGNDRAKLAAAVSIAKAAFRIGEKETAPAPLIHRVIL
jgi:pyrimidine-nucleoside phosphorylase